MRSELISTLQTVEIDDRVSTQLGARGLLRLNRAWPRDVDHLLLEYLDGNGRLIPGQWHLNTAHLQQIHKQTIAVVKEHKLSPRSTLVGRGGHAILLQPYGEDRKLRGLAAALVGDETEIVSHRPERRAVLRRRETDGEAYLKFTSPSSAQRILTAHEWLSEQNVRGFEHPQLILSDVTEGVTICHSIQGVNAASLSIAELIEHTPKIARALRGLHRLSAPSRVSTHDGNAEAQVLERWHAMASSYNPVFGDCLRDLVATCSEDLRSCPSQSNALHRDFFDKQVIITDSHQVAIIDFDTLAKGDPSLDVANYLAHIQLRCVQRQWPAAAASDLQTSFLASYSGERNTTDTDRIRTYVHSALLRLACVYSFRPPWFSLPEAIVQQIRTNVCISRS